MHEWFLNMPEEQATFFARLAIGVVVALGAIIGSFLNVCIYRIPLEQSVSTPRSHCFGCGKIIPWYHNIPIFSWLILRGKCAYCKSRISVRYLIVEVITAILFLLVFQMWGNSTLFGLNKLQLPELIPFYWLFVASTVVNVMIDIDHRILLDRISLGGTLITFVVAGFFPLIFNESAWYMGIGMSMLGAGVGFALGFSIAYLGERVFLQDAFGFGDVKWLMLFGALFGWQGVLIIMMLAAFLGLAMGIFTMAVSHRKNAHESGEQRAESGDGSRSDTSAVVNTSDTPVDAPTNNSPSSMDGTSPNRQELRSPPSALNSSEAAEPLAIPFGPALGLAALLWLFWSEAIMNGATALQHFIANHRQGVALIFLPLFLLTSTWLLLRIRAIRKAIREEELEEIKEV